MNDYELAIARVDEAIARIQNDFTCAPPGGPRESDFLILVAEAKRARWMADLLETVKYAIPYFGDIAEAAGFEVSRDGEHVSIGPRKP